jgi:hypothetical protein
MTFTVDTATARQWLDSLKRADPVDVPWAIDIARARVARAERARLAAERQAAAAAASVPRDTIAQPAGVRATPAPADTVVRRDTVVRPDSSAPPPR